MQRQRKNNKEIKEESHKRKAAAAKDFAAALAFHLTGGDFVKPVIDLEKTYGIVFDGGGARGAYQIGAWKAMREAGVKISTVAGTSVGALNGALVCMGDLERAEKIWEKITFSRVMDVDDQIMQELFDRKLPLHEAIHEVLTVIKNGGVDVTPLRELIHEMVDEEKIRQSKIAFYLLTFSLSDMKELELGIEDIPEGLLEDFLLASAYLLGFKNEELHGKKYMDGGVINNVGRLWEHLVGARDLDIIEVRIFGPGREPRVYLPDDVTVYEIAPRVKLGSIIEFQEKRSRQNMKIGYYDAKRVIYGLAGTIYYIEQTKEEWYYEKKFEGLAEHDRREIAFWLKLPLRTKEAELYLAMLEASAKYLHVPKYRIYTEEELFDLVKEKYEKKDNKEAVPYFTELLLAMGKEE